MKMARKLRSGFTTGTAAAAAVKGALRLIMEGAEPAAVRIRLMTGDDIVIPVHTCRLMSEAEAICSVIKDAGDDPDVTHGAEIGARVILTDSKDMAGAGQAPRIFISGGEGVGRVTKPGLEIDPGQPAINPVPRQMITRAVAEVLSRHESSGTVRIEIFVPRGRELAEKTLNARLGILGGISILGTTGVVRPMSHDAFIATIESALSVARAAGLERAVLTTGRRSERHAQAHWHRLPPEAFVQMGDFFERALAAAAKRGFSHITLAVFFGKALKMAQGVPHTHAAKSRLALDVLATWVFELTRSNELAQKIAAANSARQAFGMVHDRYPEVMPAVGKRIVKAAEGFAGSGVAVQSVIFDYQGAVVFDSQTR